MTLARIARRTGLAIGSIRHFFAGFDEMLAFTFAVVVARTRERAGDGPDDGGADPLDRVGAMLLHSAPGRVPHRENVAYLEYLVRARTVPHLRAEISRTQAAGEQIIGELVRAALAGTDASDEDIRLETTTVTVMLNGLALTDAYATRPLDEHDVRRIVARMLDRLRRAYPSRSQRPGG
ncbi:TetR family transcriptional regulator C-terminal domain-containing protein [Polymorphospora sp. NPDC051019]|uniref:TetR family transcriptional regulator C-terminal domain-containing protein n=1 Tax=Polymorphospora sp. NPDC051019 TaxID=3155725 RepID=UPI00343B0A7C